MKLHAPNGQLFVSQPHDFAFSSFSRNFEAVRAGVPLDQQGVIARRCKALGESGKDVGIAVVDRRCLAVHEVVGSHDVASKMLSDGLVPETHTEEGHFAGEFSNHTEGYARLGGRAGARRNEHAVRLQGEGFGRRDLIVAQHALFHAQLTEVLDEVESEGVVVVDYE